MEGIEYLLLNKRPDHLLEGSRIVGTTLPTPLTNRFVGDGDASFGEEFFDFTEAQTETMIEPDGVTDNFRRKTMALVANCFGCHASQSGKSAFN